VALAENSATHDAGMAASDDAQVLPQVALAIRLRGKIVMI
jgi:hypothetical protein